MTQTIQSSVPVAQSTSSPPRAKPHILIIGAGPAGLLRAIIAILNGNTVTLIEKRAENANGRDNTVALHNDVLNEDPVEILKKYGIYDYLEKEHLILPPTSQGLTIRLGDLEKAMKAVLSNLTKDEIIQYNSEVVEIHSKDNKAEVLVKNKDGKITKYTPDILVAADGAHGTTQKHLGISREEALEKLPVVAAIFKDNRPRIVSVGTFFKYLGITLLNTLKKIYYFTIFFFKMIFQCEHIFNQKRVIRGGLILKTPGQNYVGYCLNKSESEKLVQDAKNVEDCQAKQADAEQTNDPSKIQEAKKALDASIKQRDNRLTYYAHLSFFFANTYSFCHFFARLLCCKKREWHVAKWLPLDIKNTRMITIGADKAAQTCKLLGKTICLMAGDALATVDPTTGLGCVTAITTSQLFKDVVDGFEKAEKESDLLRHYDSRITQIVTGNHERSKGMRSLYRPDAIK